MYAQVVFNLPIEGPFDYYIPSAWEKDINPGARVEVSFGRRNCIGYVVGKVKDTKFKKVNPVTKKSTDKPGFCNGVKPISKIIDYTPVLDRTMLKITRRMADYYACSWGEAIETALPVSLRKGKRIALDAQIVKKRFQTVSSEHAVSGMKKHAEVLLLQYSKEKLRWEVCLREIENNLKLERSVILLTPDKDLAILNYKELEGRFNMKVALLHSHRSIKDELSQWIDIKNDRIKIVVGTRLAIFAPLVNLGLIIIEDEQSPVYKQDSSPHYSAVGVARIRAEIEGCRLILSSRSPTLETWYQAKKGKVKYILNDTEIHTNNIKIIDLRRVGFLSQRRKIGLSVALEDEMNKTLTKKGRVLLFLNRRGFAIFIYCHKCGTVLRCPRCNANLILHFKNNSLTCHRCNYKSQAPRICPSCNSGYIRYSGLGIEKLESELSRLYPEANISRLDKNEKIIPRNAQIIISTESIFKHRPLQFQTDTSTPEAADSEIGSTNFDLVCLISPDATLNRPDFRSAEKMFALLLRLISLTSNSLVIQTHFPRHYCFEALSQRRMDIFYEEELLFRRQVHLPPFAHIIMLRLRGRKESRVAMTCEELFNLLCNANKDRAVKVVSFSSSIPHKQRDKFYEQILVRTNSVTKAVKFLKKFLGNFRRSGIIITIDVDPV